MRKLEGIFAPTVTTFTDDEALDLEAFQENVGEHLAEAGHQPARTGHDRLVRKKPRPEPTSLLAAEEGEDDRALRSRAHRQRACQLQHRHRARRIIVRAVVNRVGGGRRPCGGCSRADVIEMRRQQDYFLCCSRIAAAQTADGIPRVRRRTRFDVGFDRDRRAVAEAEDGVVGLRAERDGCGACGS